MMTGVGFTNLGSRNAIEIGKSAYERSFGVKFFEEHEISEDGIYDYNTRVLPSNLSCGLRTDLEGQRIAVVGNGRVDASGAEIDAHDQVIRITGMRHWRRDPDGDGVRTTLWAGLPAHVVARDEAGAVHANGAFASLVRDGVALWAVSPFHVTCDAYLWLRRAGRLQDLLVAPSSTMVFDGMHAYLSAEEMSVLFSMPVGPRDLTRLTNFELLLTGTRLVLLLEACNVAQISLYGVDLFRSEPDSIWFGHDPATDLKVLRGVMRRFSASGKVFHWPNERDAADDAKTASGHVVIES